MELPITNSFKAQIKTRIQGNTLKYYLENDLFIRPDQYHLRKAYMDFLWKIKNVPLRFTDLHSENIMYDEQHNRFEIIDGSTYLAKSQNRGMAPHLHFVDYKVTIDFYSQKMTLIE